MKKYIRIMRIDHWIKQLFIIPGVVCSILLSGDTINLFKLFLGFIATCFIASANYVINEYLDAEFDKFHPTKKHRSSIENDVKGSIVFILWAVLTVIGTVIGYSVNKPFMLMVSFLWFMGVLYNVKPIRTKDIPFLDVLSESINNAIRFMLGWFIVSDNTIAPSSILLGYWMGGAFLMATKRYAEYRMINDPELAGKYRQSFKYYTEHSLLLSAFFYAMGSVFFVGVFLIKYRIELILWIPLLIGLFCYYFYISFKNDSAVQKPEKLYREKGLMIYCLILCIVFTILMFVDMPWLNNLVAPSIIQF